MNDGGIMILLIIITSFIFYKLYSVLGNGNIEIFVSKKKHTDNSNEPEMKNIEDVEEIEVFEKLEVNDKVRLVLDEVYKVEKNFQETHFIKNAASAYEYILKAFADEEKQELKKLLAVEIYEDFISDIEERKNNKLKKHHTIISLDNPTIIDAKIEDNNIWFTIEFISKQVVYYTNKQEEVVQGSKAKIESIKDTWVFTKKINSSSPIWKLEEAN